MRSLMLYYLIKQFVKLMKSKAIILALLLAIVAADLHRDQAITFTITNLTKVNVEDEDFIIAGNLFGDIEIHKNSNKHKPKTVQIINGTHISKILFIEQYEHGGKEEYVIVDESGLITIWNSKMANQLASFNLNTTVLGVTIRQRQRGVTQNRLALNCHNEVVEYSLDARTLIQTHTHNQTILNFIYTNGALLLATDNATIIVLDNNGAQVNQIQSLYGNIHFFSKHNHNEWSRRTQEVIAVTGGQVNSTAFLLHIDLADGVDSSEPLANSTITSLNYCRGKIGGGQLRERRRAIEDLIVLGIAGSSLQLRQGQFRKTWQVSEGIIDVACYQQDLFILKGNNQLQLNELDHSEHNGSKVAAFAGAFFLILILAVVGYQISKRKVTKRDKSAQTPVEEFELQERMIKK